MIYGLIPIGGKGTRLGLPYSKEMLPQKNYDIYNPVVNHLVEKMLLAGAEVIIFVHGTEYKKDVTDYFNKPSSYVHILQTELGFANVLQDFINVYGVHNLNPDDKVLFGLPDSVFNANPFVDMLHYPGIVAGCFTTSPYAKVDRLTDNNTFQVKTAKNSGNLDWFWGVIKFDICDLTRMITDNAFDKTKEIGDLLNRYEFSTVKGDKYLDLGTREGYNRYLTSSDIGVNNEIEKKYDASNVSLEDFTDFLVSTGSSPCEITSTDHYFTIENSNVEFVRFRENSDDEGAVPDITVKNYSGSQFNRFELTVELSKNTTRHNVIHLLSILGANFAFEVTKHCTIFKLPNLSIVYYTFKVNGVERKIIEIELEKADFNILSSVEDKMSKLPGFDPSAIIKQSKFQMIKEIINDTSH